ncbi:MAG: hypothetical protein F9K25_10460 [Candidatus Contendobacter sp.]|nr:MAG: hypothetical protein F9K25_10460 [Candidatus Contendobacter sp.]
MANVANDADGVVVVYAVTGWKYFTLIKGDGAPFFSDPDNFCVYRTSDRRRIKDVWFKSEFAEIWRLHDTCRVNVTSGDGKIQLKQGFQSYTNPHRCVGSFGLSCYKDKSLTCTSAGLAYPEILSTGINITKSQEIHAF